MKAKAVILGAFIFAGGVASAHGEKGVAKLRHGFMESLGAHMSSIGAVMKQKLDKPELVASHAKGIEAVSGHILEMFPEGSLTEKSHAKKAIWKKWDDFKKKAETFQKASAKLAKVASSTDDMKKIAPAVGALGKSCKGCHEDYKKSDD